jgi:hypothetical protein
MNSQSNNWQEPRGEMADYLALNNFQKTAALPAFTVLEKVGKQAG